VVRTPRRIRRTFRWIAPDRKTKWSCTIDGIDVHDFIRASFPMGLITEELVCDIELDNSGEDFTDRFKAGHIIIFKMDFSDGTTVQFEGEVEEIKSKINANGFIYSIKGSHYTAKLLDIMVTEEFTNAQISTIKTSLISDYIPDFTSTNVEENTTVINIKFVNKPLLDCLIDLDIQGDEDSYISNSKDLNSFKKNIKNNNNEAVVWNDSLFELKGLGTDRVEVRNKITVFGEAGGLPVIHTAKDSVSRTTFGTKEKVITDTSIINENQAQETADAENTRLKNPEAFGSATTLFMPQLNPGDSVYVISPPHNIHARFRLVKYVFKVPEESMEVFFSQERSIPKLFKDRIKKDLAQENIVNPFKMEFSFNFGSESGFVESKKDATSSNAVEIVEGNLRLITGNESGNMISIKKDTLDTVTSVSLQVRGETLDGVTYYVNADGTNNWQAISKDTEVVVDSDKQGKKLRLRIILTNEDTRIDSIALLYK